MKTTILNLQKERDKLLSQSYLPREMSLDINDLLSSKFIKLITGPRRVGKSTQALQMLKGKNFAYLNFDNQALLEKWDANLALRIIDEVYPNYEYLLLDEVQNIDKWDIWVSELYRKGINMVITGSNAKMLSSEMATLLTGKYLRVEMLPFSLSEFFQWNQLSLYDIKTEQRTDAIILKDDYLRNGGYPETIISRSLAQSYLNTLFDAIVWKDVVQRHKVRNTADISNLAMYLVSNFTNLVTTSGLTKELGLSSVNTTRKFMDYLHEPYLFFYLSRFNNKIKLMNKAPRKVYVVDNGFIAAKAFELSGNLGRLLENQVFVELLRKGYDTEKSLFYYRSRNDKEVDFVVRKNNQVKCLIQVCYDILNDKTLKRETGALKECADELKCDNLFIITNETNKTIIEKNHTIQIIAVTQMHALPI